MLWTRIPFILFLPSHTVAGATSSLVKQRHTLCFNFPLLFDVRIE